MVKSEISFVEVDKKNRKTAIKIQKEIFPLECGEFDINASVSGEIPSWDSFIKYYLIKQDKVFVGICGVYAYKDYPKDAWLAWFGVLEPFRRKGIGTLALNFCIETAREMGYETFRLYTDDVENATAIELYKKIGMNGEEYTNKKDLHFEVGKTFVFSLSLNGKKPALWKNKRLYLKEHDTANNILKNQP